MSTQDPRDSIEFMNYLMMRAFFTLCKDAQAPELVLRSIEQVIQARAYDISMRLRREADMVGVDLAEKIMDGLEDRFGDGDLDENRERGSHYSTGVAGCARFWAFFKN